MLPKMTDNLFQRAVDRNNNAVQLLLEEKFDDAYVAILEAMEELHAVLDPQKVDLEWRCLLYTSPSPRD